MKISLFTLFICVLLGCKNDQGDSGTNMVLKDSVELVPYEDIQFELDESTGLITRGLQYYEDNDSRSKYLVIANSHVNGLYFYDFETKERSKVLFPKEGPAGIGKLSGFYIHTLDSIFLTSSDSYKTTLVKNLFDDEKRSYQTFRSAAKKIGSSSAKPLGYNGNQTILIGDSLFVLGVPDVDPVSSSFSQLAKNLHVFNLNDSSIAAKSLYTAEYNGNIWPTHYLNYYHDYNPLIESFVYSPPTSDSILIVDHRGHYYLKFAGTQYATSIDAMKSKAYDSEARHMHYYSNASYFLIWYDKYRDVYYRFVELPNKKALDENSRTMASKVPAIVILNNKFEKVGETLLPAMEYFPVMSFVAKEGLYISQPLLLSDKRTVAEDVLRFVNFRLQKSE